MPSLAQALVNSFGTFFNRERCSESRLIAVSVRNVVAVFAFDPKLASGFIPVHLSERAPGVVYVVQPSYFIVDISLMGQRIPPEAYSKPRVAPPHGNSSIEDDSDALPPISQEAFVAIGVAQLDTRQTGTCCTVGSSCGLCCRAVHRRCCFALPLSCRLRVASR